MWSCKSVAELEDECLDFHKFCTNYPPFWPYHDIRILVGWSGRRLNDSLRRTEVLPPPLRLSKYTVHTLLLLILPRQIRTNALL